MLQILPLNMTLLYYVTFCAEQDAAAVNFPRTQLIEIFFQFNVNIFQGVPGNGHFTSNEQLTAVLTTIIYTCSVSHASTNFPQYDEYGFPPNYPGLLRGSPPKDKVKIKYL